MPVVASPLRIITTATTNATTHAPTCCVKILKQSLVTHADRESARGSKWEHLKVFRGWRKDTQSAAGVHSAYRQPRDQRTSGHYPHGSCIGVSCVEMSSPILQQESGVAVTYHKVVFFFLFYLGEFGSIILGREGEILRGRCIKKGCAAAPKNDEDTRLFLPILSFCSSLWLFCDHPFRSVDSLSLPFWLPCIILGDLHSLGRLWWWQLLLLRA